MNIPYLLFGKSILKALKANELRPPAFAGMEFAFIDHDGNEYYSWPDVGAMPPTRLKEVEAIMAMVDSGRGDAMMQEVANVIIEKCNEGFAAKSAKAVNDALGSIAALSKELIFRKTHIVPEEAWYALAAVCCARKDEDPRGLDRVIHAQKIDAFRAAGRAGDPFFMASPAFGMLLGASLTTAEGFHALRSAWILIRERHKAILKALR